MTTMPSSVPKVLASIEWFTPAFQAGGIISSLRNQVEHLGGAVDFHIVCSDRDLLEPLKLSLERNTWHQGPGHRIYYAKGKVEWHSIIESLEPDVIYINGIFSAVFSRSLINACRSRNERTILAAHGMLAPQALAMKSWLKKPWLWLHRTMGTFDDIRWHASNEHEAKQVRSWFPSSEVLVAPNLPPPPRQNPGKPDSGLRFLSVGRVHPIKNFGFAARVLAAMAYELDMEIEYLIAGPIEDFNEKRNIEQFNSGRFRCTFLGVKDRDQLSALYQNAQALLVPSLTENFGLVVAEALGHGLPVIASTSTPWGSYPSCPALQCLPLEIDLWKQGTTELARPESRESMIEIAQRFYSKHLINDAILKQHLALFAS